MTEEEKLVNIKLTPYEWHLLLEDLENWASIGRRRDMNMGSRDDTKTLWEQIASQLNGREMILYGSPKHREKFPEEFIVKEEPKVDEKPVKKRGFWKWLFTGGL